MFMWIRLIVLALEVSRGRLRLTTSFMLLPLIKEGYSTYNTIAIQIISLVCRSCCIQRGSEQRRRQRLLGFRKISSTEMKLFCAFSMCTKGELAGSMFISIKLIVFELYLSGGRFKLIAAFQLLPLTKEGYSTYRYSCNLEHQTT